MSLKVIAIVILVRSQGLYIRDCTQCALEIVMNE